jgi:hypothetical protein
MCPVLQICPVSKDDSCERHFKATIDSWQQQAAGPLPGAPAMSAAAAAVTSKGGPAAAGKDRVNRAAAALDRYLGEQQLSRQPPNAGSISMEAVAAATTPAKDGGKVRGKSADNGSSGDGQQQRPRSSIPGVIVRQLKGGSSMELVVEKHLQRLQVAAAAGGTGPALTSYSNPASDMSRQDVAGGSTGTFPKLLSPEELAAQSKAALEQEARDMSGLAAAVAVQEEKKKELASLQAKKVEHAHVQPLAFESSRAKLMI